MAKLDFNMVYDFMKNFGVDCLNINGELIIDMETNTYSSTEGCLTLEDVEMRVVFNLCRPISKGLNKKKANELLDRLNNYFSTNLTRKDLGVMYSELCYRHMFDEFKLFIEDGFPVHKLKGGTRL